MNKQIEIIEKFLLISNEYILFIPLFVFIIWIIETIWIIWYAILWEIIIAIVFAYLTINMQLFFLSAFLFFLWMILWCLWWYFISFFYYNKIIIFLKKYFCFIDIYLKKIETLFYKYHFFTFLIIINIGFLRPLLSVYLWCIKYDFKSYILWSFFACLSYVSSRVFIWYLIGTFWKIILEYLQISFYYFLALILFILFIFLIRKFVVKNRL